MKIERQQFSYGYDGKKCYIQPKVCPLGTGKMILTTQMLNVAGDDSFDGILTSVGEFGKTWQKPAPEETLSTFNIGDERITFADVWHIRHEKTGKLLLNGCMEGYSADNPLVPDANFPFSSFYAIYNSETGHYGEYHRLFTPDAELGTDMRSAASQSAVDENGDVWIPVSTKDNGCSRSGVLRYTFDGNELHYVSHSHFLALNSGRGFYEPSLCIYHGKFYLTLRTDNENYYAVSDDGSTFSEPQMWAWDTDFPMPTFNTQSHWMILKDKLYLVYTRKNGANDHVFRYRAPLYIAEVAVTEKGLRCLRHTEEVAVPERGARLGNFGVYYDGDVGYITVSEWMQPVGCEKYGCDNSFWLVKVTE